MNSVDTKNENTPPLGEREYLFARQIAHSGIPDFDHDAGYLEVLGRSAELGYPHALAKLGEYALRRHAYVEAYFWFTRARQAGLYGHALDRKMKDILISWNLAGRPDEATNVHPLFSAEDGSIGRALLDLRRSHSAPEARAYLQKYHPEYLSGHVQAGE